MKLVISMLKNLFTELIETLTSFERLKTIYSVSLYSNAAYLMIASISSALLGFVFWIIVVRFYDAEDVGVASATIAAMGLVGSFSRLGLEMGLVRFLRQNSQDTKNRDPFHLFFHSTPLYKIYEKKYKEQREKNKKGDKRWLGQNYFS